MALRKSVTDAKGVLTDYHRIARISVTPFVKQEVGQDGTLIQTPVWRMDCDILSYTAEQIRRSDDRLFADRSHICGELSQGEIDAFPVFRVAYALVKQDVRFADAEDC